MIWDKKKYRNKKPAIRYPCIMTLKLSSILFERERRLKMSSTHLESNPQLFPARFVINAKIANTKVNAMRTKRPFCIKTNSKGTPGPRKTSYPTGE